MKELVENFLKAVGANGLSGVDVRANNAISALDELGFASVSRERRYRMLNDVRRGELMTITQDKDNRVHFQLTVKGIHRLQRQQIDKLRVSPQRSWDHLWRVVMFDVPAQYSRQRALFTRELKRMGFEMIQQSVWTHPHPCFDVISELAVYCNLQRYITLCEVTRIDDSTTRKLLRRYPDIS
jgi:DNA-binding transcriptional regulator PaaX